MENKYWRWVMVSLVVTSLVEIINGITKESYAFYMGFTMVYIVLTLLVPLVIGYVAKLIASGSQKVFVKTVTIIQYVMVALVFFSLVGQVKYYFDTLA